MLYVEKQKFTQWWLWILLFGIAFIPVYGLYRQIIVGEAFGNNPLSDAGLFLYLLFMLAFLGFFRRMELSLKIDEETLIVKFWPFAEKEIKWENVTEAHVVDYGFVGGWGVRTGTRYGTIYNTSGSMGLALRLKNGKKLCIGTQRAAEVEAVLENLGR